MTFKNYIIEKIKNSQEKKKILFIDSQDPRAIQAIKMHVKHGYIEPVMLVNKKIEESELKNVKQIDITKLELRKKEFVELYLTRRKGKENEEQAEKALKDKNYIAMLLLELGEIDGVIGGLVAPTSDILRAAFKVIGPKPGIKTISSVMILEKQSEWYLFSDISVNILPSQDQLVDIGINAYNFANQIGIEPKIAFLSHSTLGSAVNEHSLKVKNATIEFNNKINSKIQAIGEIQFDAAFDPEIREMKYKGQKFQDKATIFIFPTLDSGNIGYKIAQRMGNFGAIGPIITGVNKPVNDLSRGATPEDVYNTALITALQASK